jgi:hypothetical protein
MVCTSPLQSGMISEPLTRSCDVLAATCTFVFRQVLSRRALHWLPHCKPLVSSRRLLSTISNVLYSTIAISHDLRSVDTVLWCSRCDHAQRFSTAQCTELAFTCLFVPISFSITADVSTSCNHHLTHRDRAFDKHVVNNTSKTSSMPARDGGVYPTALLIKVRRPPRYDLTSLACLNVTNDESVKRNPFTNLLNTGRRIAHAGRRLARSVSPRSLKESDGQVSGSF